MNVPTATSVETTTSNSIKRAISGFFVAGGTSRNIAWTLNFNTQTTPGIQSIRFRLKGRVNAQQEARIRGSEEVFDTTSAPAIQIGSGLLVKNVPAGAAVDFDEFVDIPLASVATEGFISKDISVRAVGAGAGVEIYEVEQLFTPVPEPATMVALGLGAAALMRRRKKA